MPKWRTLGRVLAGMVVLVVAVPFAATAETDTDGQTAITNRRLPEVRHALDKTYPSLDRPSPPVRVVIPRITVEEEPLLASIPKEETRPDNQPPALEPDPESPKTGTATFFGIPINGTFVFVLDLTGSMGAPYGGGQIQDHNGNVLTHPSRVQKLQSEMIRAINSMGEADKFAIVTHGGVPDRVVSDSDLVYATSTNKQSANRRVVNMIAGGSLGAYPALKEACKKYGNELNQMLFLTDGGSNTGGTNAEILMDFPGWYKELRDNGCLLICIQIGGSLVDREFLSALANSNNGMYIMGG
jgi:hypothetical protein